MSLSKRPFTHLLMGSFLLAPLALGSLTLSSMAQAEEKTDAVRFAIPPWPGVTVKSQVAATLLDTLGYTTQKQELGATIAYQALSQNELDVYLAARPARHI